MQIVMLTFNFEKHEKIFYRDRKLASARQLVQMKTKVECFM